MKAGNAEYAKPSDLPEAIPVFPLADALLLPGGCLPLNIFEPRYLDMIDHALAGSRLIGMVQPRLAGGKGAKGATDQPDLCELGCVGRIVSYAETGDGRYLVSLDGVCRFRLVQELPVATAFRQCRIRPLAEDLREDRTVKAVDRDLLLDTFQAYLDANDLRVDWENVERTETSVLVNALSMLAPCGAAEKQALLEAPNAQARAQALIAITEMALAGGEDDGGRSLQ